MNLQRRCQPLREGKGIFEAGRERKVNRPHAASITERKAEEKILPLQADFLRGRGTHPV